MPHGLGAACLPDITRNYKKRSHSVNLIHFHWPKSHHFLAESAMPFAKTLWVSDSNISIGRKTEGELPTQSDGPHLQLYRGSVSLRKAASGKGQRSSSSSGRSAPAPRAPDPRASPIDRQVLPAHLRRSQSCCPRPPAPPNTRVIAAFSERKAAAMGEWLRPPAVVDGPHN